MEKGERIGEIEERKEGRELIRLDTCLQNSRFAHTVPLSKNV